MGRGENTGEKRKKKIGRVSTERGKNEREGTAISIPLTCRRCRGSVRVSSMTKCQLSPWATVNEEEFMGNIRD